MPASYPNGAQPTQASYGGQGTPTHPYAGPPAPASPMPYVTQTSRPPSPTDTRAVVALGLGVLSMTCLGFLAGVPAIVIGAMTRKEIDRSQGALEGRGLAAGGIVTGLFGTGLSLIVLVALVARGLAAVDAPEASTVPAVAAGTRSYGSLDVVDLDGARALKPQLAAIARAASANHRTVILQTYVRTSKECAEVAAALPDARMQRALSNVTLVRVDIQTFEEQLDSMRVDTSAAPWFYTLDGSARITDAISADEWDANVPENMAPILGAFARGKLNARRAPATPAPAGTAL